MFDSLINRKVILKYWVDRLENQQHLKSHLVPDLSIISVDFFCSNVLKNKFDEQFCQIIGEVPLGGYQSFVTPGMHVLVHIYRYAYA